MKKETFLAIIALLLFTVTVNAQSLSGKVIDAQTGEPLPGATVHIVGQKGGVVTNQKGEYTIAVKQSGLLRVTASFLGYETEVNTFKIEEVSRKGLAKNNKNVEEIEYRVPAPIAGHLSFRLRAKNFVQEEVVVTGTKVQTALSNIPLTTSVLGHAQIEQSAELNLLPMLGQKVPGLFVTQRGITGFGIAEGAAGKIAIRGVGSSDQSQLLVMIDGQPQFMGIFGHGFPDMYQSANVERVEVIRGPASVLYGTNSMGGVVNIITQKKNKQGLSLNLTGQYGSFGTLRGNLQTGYNNEAFSVWFSASHDQTNGHRPSSSFRGNNGHAGFEVKMGKHFSARFSTQLTNFRAIDPGPLADSLKYANDAAWADVTRFNGMLTVKNSFDKAEGHVNVFYNQGDHEIYTNWLSIDRNYGVSVFEGLRLFKNNLTGIGVDWNQYGGQGNTVEPFDNWQQVTETGVYGFLQHTFFDRLTLNSGIRYQNHSLYGGQWVPQAGATFRMNENDEWKAMVSKGFRSPNVRELYFFPPSNPELKPEQLWNYEVGYTRFAFNKKLKSGINLFYMNGENLIMLVPNPVGGFPPMKNMNSGAFTHFGAELELRYRIHPGLTVDASYAYLNMDTPKIAAPVHQAQAGLSFAHGRFDGSISAQAIAGLYTRLDNQGTDNVNEEAKQGFLNATARINFRMNRTWSLFLSGNNLLNSTYETNYGYPMPGISWMVGFLYRLNE